MRRAVALYVPADSMRTHADRAAAALARSRRLTGDPGGRDLVIRDADAAATLKY